MLSNLSSIPPWLKSKDEKSLIFKNLFIYEKKISPINKKDEIIMESKILLVKKNNTQLETKKDKVVPDQVFFGLMFGTIKGPPIDFPTI